MAAIATADMARMHLSSVLCGLAERWHISDLLDWAYRLCYSIYRNGKLQKSVHPRSSSDPHSDQVVNELPDKQYANKTERNVVLLERHLERNQSQQMLPLSPQEINYVKRSTEDSDGLSDGQLGDLLERVVQQPATSCELMMGEAQSLGPSDVATLLQDNGLTGGIRITFDTSSAVQVEKIVVSTETELPTTNEKSPADPHCSNLSVPPSAANTPLVHDLRISEETPAPCTIDMAFEEDTRLWGLHPANFEAEQSAKLDNMMPKGYRYARDLQSDLVFIPPLNHPQGIPGNDFVIQKKGTHAVAIIKPPTAVNEATVRNVGVQHKLSQVTDSYQPSEQNALTANGSLRQYNSTNAHQSVYHFSDHTPLSPTSRVIAAINANPPSPPLAVVDHAPVASMYGVSHIPTHYEWPQPWHNTGIPSTEGMDTSYSLPCQYFEQPQYFATPFDQTTIWGAVQDGYTYETFQGTWCGRCLVDDRDETQ